MLNEAKTADKAKAGGGGGGGGGGNKIKQEDSDSPVSGDGAEDGGKGKAFYFEPPQRPAQTQQLPLQKVPAGFLCCIVLLAAGSLSTPRCRLFHRS
jgi:hypothetical protein